MRNIVAFLEQVDALHGVQETVLKRLATRCDTKLYGTYNTIIRQGENVSKLYFIKHGKVKVKFSAHDAYLAYTLYIRY